MYYIIIVHSLEAHLYVLFFFFPNMCKAADLNVPDTFCWVPITRRKSITPWGYVLDIFIYRSSSHSPTLHFLQVYQWIWQEVELFSKGGITERHNFWTVIKSKVIFWKHKFKKFFINLCLVGVLTGTSLCLCLSHWSFFILFQSLVSTAAARVEYTEVMPLVMMYSCEFRGSNDLRRSPWLQKYNILYAGFGWF